MIFLKDTLEKKIDEEINFKLIEEVKNFNNTLTKLLSEQNKIILNFFQKRKMDLILIMVLTFLMSIQNFLGFIEFIVFVIMKNYLRKERKKFLNEDIHKNLNYLLQQTPVDDTPYLFDKYIFFGVGKSLIVIPSSQKDEEIKKIIDLMDWSIFLLWTHLLNSF